MCGCGGELTDCPYPNCPPDDEDQDPEPVDNPEQPQ